MKQTFVRAILVLSYIYICSGLVNMMRQFTKMNELLRPTKTSFATVFITLSRIFTQKSNLRKMFTLNVWATSKWAKERGGRKVVEIISMHSFWNNVVFALKVFRPLVCVLRLVDGERKPLMGYIYEAMDRAKEAIARSFKWDEKRYEEIFRIIDIRWNVQLHRPLHGVRALRRRYEMRDTIDPIYLNDIDDNNEWLIRRFDDENERDNELVFTEDDGLTWNVVYIAA
ncbi:hypothetical protein LWI29_002363 [Acer saccharum]|uniref:Uncharacterized protein n=1 Tax=Acer saccharum TaxID=4024 RepID=A0AA39S6P4_ACESA|nr:hypothetical protein LWI29_002363 [Acer saccharum]